MTMDCPYLTSPSSTVPHSSSSSDSSSDSDLEAAYIQPAYIQQQTSQIMSSHKPKASVEHPITKHCPVLSPGEPIPQVLLSLENAFNEFFIAKGIDDKD